jgi:hypothetical protein
MWNYSHLAAGLEQFSFSVLLRRGYRDVFAVLLPVAQKRQSSPWSSEARSPLTKFNTKLRGRPYTPAGNHES